MPAKRISRQQVVDVLGDQAVTGTVPTPEPVVESVSEPGPERRLRSVKSPEELTPEQRRIRELEDRLAQEMGKKDPGQEFEEADQSGDTILVHFVADGFTALGQNWHRGQELEFTVGSGAYRDTCDRLGRSWLALREDPAAQEERWGEVKFRPGPWTGLTYQDAATKARFEPLKGAAPFTVDELAQADAAEQRRRRAAPRLPSA